MTVTTDDLILIPDQDASRVRENMRRIEEWAKTLIARVTLIDGGGP